MADKFNKCNGSPYSNIWLPALTNSANISASTAFAATSFYDVIGGQVSFNFTVDMTPIAPGEIILLASLPIAVSLASDRMCCGVGVAVKISGPTGMTVLNVSADTATNQIRIRGFVTDIGSTRARITGKYLL